MTIPSYEAEALALVIQKPKAYLDELFSQVTPLDFYYPPHRAIAEKILLLGEKTGKISLEIAINDANEWHLTGGTEYLGQLSDLYVTSSIDGLIETIRDKSIRNSLQQYGAELSQSAHRNELDEIERKFQEIISRGEGGTFERIGDILPGFIDELEEKREGKRSELQSGYTAIDKALGGLYGSNLIVIGGRPGKGKTTFALNIFEKVTMSGQGAGFFSVEMSRHEMVGKLISLQTDINYSKLRDATHLDDHDFANIARSMEGLKTAPMFIDDTPSIGLYELRSKARRMVRKGARLIIVDYLQIMGTEKGIPREQQVSNLSKGLKDLARQLEVPVIAITQLNRESEKGSDNKPKLHHIRESGSIEQDSDSVLFVHRQDEDCDAEIVIAKNRHGVCKDIPMVFTGATGRFKEVTR